MKSLEKDEEEGTRTFKTGKSVKDLSNKDVDEYLQNCLSFETLFELTREKMRRDSIEHQKKLTMF